MPIGGRSESINEYNKPASLSAGGAGLFRFWSKMPRPDKGPKKKKRQGRSRPHCRPFPDSADSCLSESGRSRVSLRTASTSVVRTEGKPPGAFISLGSVDVQHDTGIFHGQYGPVPYGSKHTLCPLIPVQSR
jgi:hypothetical protein